MSPFVDDPDFTLYVGDALEVLRDLPAESVHCCVTSPPYWGLRDYGTGTWFGGDADCDHLGKPFRTKSKLNENWGAGFSDVKNAEDTEPMCQECSKCGATRIDQQLGLEPTPDEYVANMVAVFREVRRVLRADGTLWLNIGDSYVGGGRGGHGDGIKGTPPQGAGNSPDTPSHNLKPKDLVGIPWRLAFALQTDGWYLRSDIIWSKPNPMPESVTDRPTKAHEYLFLLTKSPRYFYDADAIREPAEWARWGDQTNGKHEGSESAAGWIKPKTREELNANRSSYKPGSASNMNDGEHMNPAGRNKRSVWEIPTAPYPDAHFATFPPALVEPCVKAGTSEHGCCPVCGAPWLRETDVSYEQDGSGTTGFARGGFTEPDGRTTGTGYAGKPKLSKNIETTGWRPTCDHDATPIAATVLDPFLGSGTTAQVARRLGRHSIGIELNPEYAELCARRLQQLSLLT